MIEWAPPQPNNDAIAARWKAQYFRHNIWRTCGDDRGSQAVHADLLALGLNPHPAAIEKVIGNDSWTRPDANDLTTALAA